MKLEIASSSLEIATSKPRGGAMNVGGGHRQSALAEKTFGDACARFDQGGHFNYLAILFSLKKLKTYLPNTF